MRSHFAPGSTNHNPTSANPANRFAPPPPPPPRPPSGDAVGDPRRFPPPGPPPQRQQQQPTVPSGPPGRFHPPPPPAAVPTAVPTAVAPESFFDQPSHPPVDDLNDHDDDDDRNYDNDDDGDDDYDDDGGGGGGNGEGALGATISLVTSAASMFFKAATSPPQQQVVPPPPQPAAAASALTLAPTPPAPIESIYSMLDDSEMMSMNTMAVPVLPSPHHGQVLHYGERSTAGAPEQAQSHMMSRPPSQPPTPTAPILFQPPPPPLPSSHSHSHPAALTPSSRPPVPPVPMPAPSTSMSMSIPTPVKLLSAVTTSTTQVFGLANSPRIAVPSSPRMVVPSQSPVVMLTPARPLLPNLHDNSSGATRVVPSPLHNNRITAMTPIGFRPPSPVANLAFPMQPNLRAGVGSGSSAAALSPRFPPPDLTPQALPSASTLTVAPSTATIPHTPLAPPSASEVFTFSRPPPTPTTLTQKTTIAAPVAPAAGPPPPIPLPVPRVVRPATSESTESATSSSSATIGSAIPLPTVRGVTPPSSPVHRMWPAAMIPMSSSIDVTKTGGNFLDIINNNNTNHDGGKTVAGTKPKMVGSGPFVPPPSYEEPPSSPLTPLITNQTLASSTVAKAYATPSLEPTLTDVAIEEEGSRGYAAREPPLGIAMSPNDRTVKDTVHENSDNTTTTIRSTTPPPARRVLRLPPPNAIPSISVPTTGLTSTSTPSSRPKFRLPTPRKRVVPVAVDNPVQTTHNTIETGDPTITTEILSKLPPTIDEDVMAATAAAAEPSVRNDPLPLPSTPVVGTDTTIVVANTTPVASLDGTMQQQPISISPPKVEDVTASVYVVPIPIPDNPGPENVLTTVHVDAMMNTTTAQPPTIYPPPIGGLDVLVPSKPSPPPAPSLDTSSMNHTNDFALDTQDTLSMDHTNDHEPENSSLLDDGIRPSSPQPIQVRVETTPSVAANISSAFIQPSPSMDTESNPEETSPTLIAETPDKETVVQDDSDEYLPPFSSAEPTTAECGIDMSPPDTATLPAGWSEIADPTSGQVYYYNSSTYETSWELPRQEPLMTNDEGNDEIHSPIAMEESYTSGTAPAIDSTLDLLNAEFGLDTDGTEQYETMPTSRLENIGQEREEVDVGGGAPPDTAGSHFGEDEQEQENDLPEDDWVEVNDPTSGSSYFYNRITGETSWDKPSAPETTLEEENSSHCNAEDVEPETTTGGEDGDHRGILEPETEMEVEMNAERDDLDTQMNDPLPPGWTELVDPSTGHQYYFNQITEETSWTRPSSMETLIVGETRHLDDDVNNLQLEQHDYAADEKNDSSPQEEFDSAAETPKTTLGQDEFPLIGAVPGFSIGHEGDSEAEMYSNIDNEGGVGDDMPIYDTITTEKDTKIEETTLGVECDPSVETDTDLPREDGQSLVEIVDEVGDRNDNIEDPLPVDWVEISDPTTGQTYFYNSMSGESTWERPNRDTDRFEEAEVSSVCSEANSPMSENCESNPEIALEPEESPGTDGDGPPDTLDTFVDELLEGWEECEDPNSGKIYYYNSSTGESSWERPSLPHEQRTETGWATSTEEDKEKTQNGHPEIHAATCDNNDGSNSVDNSIHGDEHLRDSVVEGARVENEGREFGEIMTGTEVNGISGPTKRIDGELDETLSEGLNIADIPLIEGWVEAFDPSGKVYYYNALTGDVAWDRPEMSPETSSHPNESEEEVGENGASVESSIPVVTPIVGNEYAVESKVFSDGQDFENDGTDQKTMTDFEGDGQEVMPSLSQPSSRNEMQNLDQLSEEAETNEQSNANPLFPDWDEAVDEISGQTYYFNRVNGETSWEWPPTPTESAADAKESSTEHEDTGEIVVSSAVSSENPDEMKAQLDGDTASNSEDLPDGWVEAWDPHSGNAYYVNSITGESAWERPIRYSESIDDADKEEFDNIEPDPQSDHGIEDHLQGEELQLTVSHPTELPEGWSEEQDPSSGKMYFYNNVTNEIQWERASLFKEIDGAEVSRSLDVADPDESSEEQRIKSQEAGDVISNMPLPEGWSKDIDAATGLFYYFNELTGENSWEIPSNIEPELVQDKDDDIPPAEEPFDSLDRKYLLDSEVSTPEIHSIESEHCTGDSEVPSGWEEVSHLTGVYYYHVATGETTWEKPTLSLKEPEEQLYQSTDPPVDLDHAIDTSTQSELEMENEGERAKVGSEDLLVGEEGSIKTQQHSVANSYVSGKSIQEGWDELQDPSSGEVYFYNRVTGETSWEKPIMSEEPVMERHEITNPSYAHDNPIESILHPVLGTVNQENDVDDQINRPLPHGWERISDSSSDQVYYCNTETFEKRWDFPTSECDPGDNHQVEASEEVTILAKQFQEEQIVQTDDNETLSLPWSKVTDPTTNQVYYCNETTGERRWDRPSQNETSEQIYFEGGEAELDVFRTRSESLTATERSSTPTFGTYQDAPAGSDEASVPHEYSEESKEDWNQNGVSDPLPNGWVEVSDEVSGKVYFYHSESGATSWDKPGHILKTNAFPMEDNSRIEADGDDTETMRPGIEMLGAPPSKKEITTDGWEDVVNHLEGDSNRPNNTETSIPEPGPPSEPFENISIDQLDGNGFVDEDTKNRAESRIQDDWVDVDVAHLAETNQINADETTLHEIASVSALPLQSNWVELTDPSTSEKYYFNKTTEETRWERPCIVSTEEGQNVEDENPAQSEAQLTARLLKENVLEQNESVTITALSVEKIEEERTAIGASYPFAYADDSVVLEFIGKKAKAADILWQLIEIAVRSDGRLRSDEGVIDKSSPESAIVELLLQDSGGIATDSTKPNRQVLLKQKSDPEGLNSIQRVEELLVRGQRLKAVHEAMSIGDFAAALFVASMCDTITYNTVARTYAEQTFATSSPMYTTALLFSKSLEAPSSRRPENWGINPSDLKVTWKTHLAAIISNRRDGWDNIVLSLGDRLREIGLIMEAHFCYMVCGCPISKPTNPDSRISLLGCDHSDPTNVALLTEESLTAYERTEAYEWAKRKGNKNASLRSFQPFKLMYAMLLADFGQIERAKSFIESIRLSAGVVPVHLSEAQYVVVNDMFDDESSFALVCDETRRQLYSKQGPSIKFSQSFLKGEAMMIQVGPSLPIMETDSYRDGHPNVHKPQRHEGTLQRDSLSSEQIGLLISAETLHVNTYPQTGLPDPDSSFLSTKSNLLDVTGYSLDMPVTHKSSEPMAQTKLLAPVEEISNLPAQIHTPESPSSAMMTRPVIASTEKAKSNVKQGNAKTNPINVASTPQEQKRPKPAPATAPPVMIGEKAKIPRTPAPSSGGVALGLSSFRSWVIRKFNPDATECHLPDDGGNAYFDKDLNRWIFPGDDPAEVAKPLPPPPMVPKAGIPTSAPTGGRSNDASLGNQKNETLSDPLAAMMAPPSRAPSSVNRSGYGGSAAMRRSGQYNPGMMPPGGPPPGLLSPAPVPVPQFAVFTPNPTAKRDEDSAVNANAEG